MGLFSIFGRVFFGYLTDVLSHQMVYTLVQAVSSAGILALVAADSTDYPILLYTYAACYGLGQGSRALGLSAISADVFLGRNFGAIYGYFTHEHRIRRRGGDMAGGASCTMSTANYTIPFMIAFGNFVVSILMVWGIRFLKGSRDHAFK